MSILIKAICQGWGEGGGKVESEQWGRGMSSCLCLKAFELMLGKTAVCYFRSLWVQLELETFLCPDCRWRSGQRWKRSPVGSWLGLVTWLDKYFLVRCHSNPLQLVIIYPYVSAVRIHYSFVAWTHSHVGFNCLYSCGGEWNQTFRDRKEGNWSLQLATFQSRAPTTREAVWLPVSGGAKASRLSSWRGCPGGEKKQALEWSSKQNNIELSIIQKRKCR